MMRVCHPHTHPALRHREHCGRRHWAARLRYWAGRLLMTLGLLLAPIAARALDVQVVRSPGGIEAWLLEDAKAPVVAIDFAFRGGSALDPPDKGGLAQLLATLLLEGAGELDGQAFQARLEDQGIRLGFSASRDSFQGSLQTLSPSRAEAFTLLRLALVQPRLDVDALDRVRLGTRTGLRREAGSPDSVAQRQFFESFFAGHPYGQPPRGTADSVARITPEDLHRFVHERLTRDTLLVTVAGAISAAELAPVLDQIFGGLPVAGVPYHLPEAVPQGLGQVVVERRPTEQSVFVLGQPGLKRDDPDWFAGLMVNHSLGGGGFASRLTEEVRAKRGLTYGIYSRNQAMDFSAVLLVSGSTANARAHETLEIIRSEWARMARDGLEASELADAKAYLKGAFPLQLASTSGIAAALLQVRRDRQPPDYLQRRNELIDAVTLEDTRRVAARWLTPDALLTVIIGAPEGVTAQP